MTTQEIQTLSGELDSISYSLVTHPDHNVLQAIAQLEPTTKARLSNQLNRLQAIINQEKENPSCH